MSSEVYEIMPHSSGGKFLRAQCAISAGTTIMRCRSVLSVLNQSNLIPDPDGLLSKFKKFNDDLLCNNVFLQATYHALSLTGTDSKAGAYFDNLRASEESICMFDPRHVQAIAQLLGRSRMEVEDMLAKVVANSFRVVGQLYHTSVGLLFPMDAVHMNHSCSPNASVSFILPDLEVIVTADRNIKQGEEITHTYAQSILPLPVLARQTYLRKTFQLVCKCARCQEDFRLLKEYSEMNVCATNSSSFFKTTSDKSGDLSFDKSFSQLVPVLKDADRMLASCDQKFQTVSFNPNALRPAASVFLGYFGCSPKSPDRYYHTLFFVGLLKLVSEWTLPRQCAFRLHHHLTVNLLTDEVLELPAQVAGYLVTLILPMYLVYRKPLPPALLKALVFAMQQGVLSSRIVHLVDAFFPSIFWTTLETTAIGQRILRDTIERLGKFRSLFDYLFVVDSLFCPSLFDMLSVDRKHMRHYLENRKKRLSQRRKASKCETASLSASSDDEALSNSLSSHSTLLELGAKQNAKESAGGCSGICGGDP